MLLTMPHAWCFAADSTQFTMAYKITIEQNPITANTDITATEVSCVGIKIFEQTVESLNLKAVINAINATPRKPRTPKAK